MALLKEKIDKNITYRYYTASLKDTLSACKWILDSEKVFDELKRLRIRKSEHDYTDFPFDVSADTLCDAITDEHTQIDIYGIYKNAHIYIIVDLKDFTVALVRQNREEDVFDLLEKDLNLSKYDIVVWDFLPKK